MLSSASQAYIITQLRRYKEITFDIAKDIVTVSSSSSLDFLNEEKRNITVVKFYGAVNNGEVVECFMNNAYETLPVKGRIVIDVGSNIGDSSIYFALRGARKIIAIEPFIRNFETAKKNIASNNLSHKITLILAGCSANPGHFTTGADYQSDVSSSIRKDRIADAKAEVTVPLLTLDKIMTSNNVPPKGNILKMDCEGCEYETILSASKEILQAFSHIQIEYHHGYADLKEKLKKSNFEVSVTRPIKHRKLYIGYVYARQL